MSRGDGRSLTRWSVLVIALAVARAGLDALPAGSNPAAPAREASHDDESPDVEGADESTAPGFQSRRARAAPARAASARARFAPSSSWRATRHASTVEMIPRRTILLCRFRC